MLDQWRTCSDKHYPPSEPVGSQSSQTNFLTRYTLKKGDKFYQQPPPRPGGLKRERDNNARSRPVRLQYLYENSPPNSTIISNVIDCMKDNC